jgi:hypothetical protein
MPSRREQLEKQPSETFPIDINFNPAMPLGSIGLASATVSAVKWPRRRPTEITNATSELLFSTNALIIEPPCGMPKTRARIVLQNGTHDFDYKVTILGVFESGATLETEIFVRVRGR